MRISRFKIFRDLEREQVIFGVRCVNSERLIGCDYGFDDVLSST